MIPFRYKSQEKLYYDNCLQNPQVVREQLRQIVFDKRDGRGLDYTAFKARMDQQDFTPVQRNLLHMRLELLESFLDGLLENIGIVCYEDRMPERYKASKAHDQKKVWINEQVAKRKALPDIWSCEPGSLTIVDLTDPLVQDGESACAMFNMCLDLFLENQPEGGTMLALDEAHKVSAPFHVGKDELTNSST